MSSNPYYDPGDFGLEIVGNIDLAEPDYSFDMLVVWFDRRRSGIFYWASDSGCSCPSPFEDYHSTEQLEHGSEQDAIRMLLGVKETQDRQAGEYDYDLNEYVSTGQGYASAAIVDLVSKIRLGDYLHLIHEEMIL